MAPVPQLRLPANPVKVGRDGFFSFGGTLGTETDAATLIADIDLEVRNKAGELVPGEIGLLLDSPADTSFLLGWETKEPLEAGETLTVSARLRDSSSAVEYVATLEVLDELAELAVPPLEFGAWESSTRDVGPTQSCPYTPSAGPCSPNPPTTTLEFGTNVQEVHTVVLESSSVPRPRIVTAWQYSAEPVPGKGTLFAEPVPSLLFSEGQPFQTLILGVMFSDVVDEYCVLVTVRDLRTDQKLSQELCSSPERPLPHANYDRVRSCSEVAPEFVDRWCDGRDGSFSSLCGAHSAGGSGGAVPAGSGGSTAAVAEDTETERELTERGCACRTAPAPRDRDAALAFVGLTLVAGLGLRRRSR